MNFELQPSASNTQDDLDAQLEKARAEAAARESSEVKESAKTEISGIDSLLSEIKEEKEPEKPVDKTEKIG